MPCCTSISRPSWAGIPAARSARTHRVPPRQYTRSSAALSRSVRAGSSGNGSVSFRPSGVALMATSGCSAPRAGCTRAPRLLAQSAKRWARAASRDSTCTSASSSVQKVLHAPTRAHRSVLRARHRSAASLWGTVTFPDPPTTARAARTGGSASAGVGSATYTASRPSARSAALCMAGDNEWVTGSPITTSSRVLALISTARKLFHDPLHCGVDQGFELDAGVAVHLEVAPERVAHLCGVALTPGVLAQHEHVAFTAQLVDAGAVMARHSEDEIRLLDQLPREQPGAVGREVEPALEADEIRPL